MSYVYEVTAADLERIRVWSKEQDAKNITKNLTDPNVDPFARSEAESGHAYYGAIGGSLTYEFTPTSIGLITRVRHANGEVFDYTDYDRW